MKKKGSPDAEKKAAASLSAKRETGLRAGHRSRLRKRYLRAGADGFTDDDLVELLLTYAIPRRDVKVLARSLLTKYRDAGGLLDAPLDELCEINGLSENSALLFRLMRDFCLRYLEGKMRRCDVINSPDRLENYARMKLGGDTDESIMSIFLNIRNHVIASEVIASGTVDEAVIYPRNIVAEALKYKATGVILVHNHPSGNTAPSKADLEMTEAVRRSLAMLDIKLLDHLIVSRGDSFSFYENKLLKCAESVR